MYDIPCGSHKVAHVWYYELLTSDGTHTYTKLQVFQYSNANIVKKMCSLSGHVKMTMMSACSDMQTSVASLTQIHRNHIEAEWKFFEEAGVFQCFHVSCC